MTGAPPPDSPEAEGPVAPRRAPRRPPRRRLWLLLLVPLGVATAALLALQSEWVTGLATRALEQAVQAAIWEKVSIGGIEVTYLPPRIEIQQIIVTHTDTDDTIAAVRSISVTPGMEGIRPVWRELRIEAPRVALHLDVDGLREFRGIPPAASGAASRFREFPWREMVIQDGQFSLDAPSAEVVVTGIQVGPGVAPGRMDVTLGGLTVRSGAIVQEARAVVLPGVTFTPDRIELPSFDLRFDALRLDGWVAVADQGPLAGDLSLHLDLGRLTGTGPVDEGYIDGRVDIDATLGGTVAAPEVEGAVAVEGLVIWDATLKGPTAVRIGDAHGPWRLDLGAPVVDEGQGGGEGPGGGDGPGAAEAMAIEVGPLDMQWAEGTIEVRARVEPGSGFLSAGLIAEGVHFAPILQAIGAAPTPWVDLTGDVETHVVGTLAPFRIRGPFEISVTDFHVNDGPVGAASGTMLAVPKGTIVGKLEADVDRLVLDGRVVTRASRGHVRADIGFGPNPLGVDVDFPVLDLAQLQPLSGAGLGGLAEVHGWVGGPFDALRADGTLEVAGAVVLGLPIADHLAATFTSDMVRLHFADIQARLGETAYQGEFEIAFTDPMWIDTQVYVGAGRIHDLAGVFVDIGPADGRVSGAVILSGEPYHLDGEVMLDLADVDLYGERFATGHATAWMDQGELTIEELSVERPNAAVLVRGSVKGGYAMNLEVLSDGFTLEGLDHLRPLGLPLTGDLAVDAQIGGTLLDPAPRGRLGVVHTYYDGIRLADTTVDFATSAGVLAWDGDIAGEGLHTRGSVGLFGDQPYEATGRFDYFPLHLLYPKGRDGGRVVATITGDLELAGRFGETPTPVDIEGRFSAVEARWSGHTLSAPEPWTFAVHGASVQVPRLRLVGNDGTDLGFEGYRMRGGQISFRGGGSVNLDLARAWVPGLELAQGMAEVEVAIHGDATRRSDVSVGLKTTGATVRSAYFPADFEHLSARVDATRDGYVLRDVSAEVGGGTFTSPESAIDAVEWAPSRFRLAGQLRDSRLQYLDYLPPIVGDADLKFDGPVDDLLLSGEIRIDEMEFRDRVDWEGTVLSLREERLTGSAPVEGERYFSMDLAVNSEDTIRLRNNVADAEASARLRIVGDTARPGMVGEIRVEPGGRTYLHEREFEVARGDLRFVDPYTFDPDLDVLLETEVRSHDQEYRVSYGVTGPFSDWSTNTSSDPYLAQADVNALLLFGVTREELERYGGLGTALVAETSDLLLAQTAISRANLFIIDRWSLVSGVSERGSNTVSSDLRLVAEKQVGAFDFTVEKRLGVNLESDWYASVERRLAERLYATAYVATRQEGRSLPIGAAYGAEFKFRWELD